MKKNYFLNLICGVLYENAIWGTEVNSNSLVKIDVNTGVTTFVSELGSAANRPYSYNNIVEYQGKIILIPGSEEKIIVYDIASGKLNAFDFDGGCCKEGFAKFSSYRIYHNVLYLFPYFMPFILKIYLDTMEVEYLNAGIEEQGIWKENKGVFIASALIEDAVYLPCAEDNKICIFDLKKETNQWIEIQNQSEAPGFLSAAHDGKNLYLTNKNLEMIPFNQNMQATDEGILIKSDSIIEYDKGNMWIISRYKDGISKYSFQSQHIQTLKYPEDYRRNPTWSDSTPTVKNIIRKKDKIYIVPRFSNMLTAIDLNEQKLDCKPIKISKTVSALQQKYIYRQLEEKKKIFEPECNLADFIEFVKIDKNQIKQKDVQNYGKLIFQKITEKKTEEKQRKG